MTLADFLNRCSFARLSSELLQSCNPFKCGNEDLDEFFREDFRLYGEKLLGKTYVFRLRERPESIVAAFTISNDSIRIKQLAPEDKAKIEYVTENGEKNLRRYPGVLVGRLGTNIEFAKQGFGSAVMDFIKAWFRSDENKTLGSVATKTRLVVGLSSLTRLINRKSSIIIRKTISNSFIVPKLTKQGLLESM